MVLIHRPARRADRRPGPLTILLSLGLAAAPFAGAQEPAATVDRSETERWYASGAAALERQREALTRRTRARNVVLFLGDGMGVPTVTAARILAGQLEGGAGEDHVLAFEALPVAGLVKTYNTDQQVPDSAGTMSAIVSGVKTRAGVISVGPEVPRGDCAAARDHGLTTLLDLAEARGMATGVLSTARITHATPAAAYAHAPERNWEADAEMPRAALDAGCRDIARQLVEYDAGDGIEVVLGGGRAMFLPADTQDPEYPPVPGRRADGVDLTALWRERHPDGAYVWNGEQFGALDPEDPGPVLGLFEPSHMRFEADRADDPGTEPSLAEMTAFALDKLGRAGGRRGFLLIVEAGRIDHAHHAANAHRALHDTIALSDAVAVVRERTDPADTLLIVTADHGHTLTIGGYPRRGNPILGKVRVHHPAGDPEGLLMPDASGLPFTTLAYANGPGHVAPSATQPAGAKRYPHRTGRAPGSAAPRPDLTDVDTTAPDYLQEGAVPLGSETHGGEDVPLFASGPGSQWLTGVLEQHVIFHAVREALRL